MSDNVTDINEILKSLIDRHYEISKRPLYLADIGSAIKDKTGHYPKEVLGVGLKAYLEEGFFDDYVVVRHPRIAQKIAVAPKRLESEVYEELTADSPIELGKYQTKFDIHRVHRSLILAFQSKPKSDENVYVRTTPPIRFKVSQNLPFPTQECVFIDKDLLCPNMQQKKLPELNEDERRVLSDKIQEWLNRKELTAKTFYFDARKKSDIGVQSAEAKTSKNALQRLINAQSDEVRRRLLIPADIAIYLTSIK